MKWVLAPAVLSLFLVAPEHAAAAGAQQAPSVPSFDRGTALGVLVGGASSTHLSGTTVAGIVSWQITRWVAVEGRAGWFDAEAQSDGFGADIGLLVNVVPSQRVTPYVGAAFGLYRASFEPSASSAADFYRSRIGAPDGVGSLATFTDPAARFSFGVDVVARRYLSIRPEASAMVVFRRGDSYAAAILGLRLGYRFEDHPVTPGR
jgi:hypothetical protein